VSQDPDRFPFEAHPSQKWPGWQVLLCRQFGQTFLVGYYKLGDLKDEEKLAKDLRQMRAIWAQTAERRRKARAAVAALTTERNP
jgi:hypothetical protein